MINSPYDLPGLKQLESFEAAARHLSFKKAADELDVTSSAISHQIRILERNLSATLFDRSRKQIELTSHGAVLFQELQASFTHLGRITENIRQYGATQTVEIASSPEVLLLWLNPLVTEFTRENSFRVYQERRDAKVPCSKNQQLQIIYGRSAPGADDDPCCTELFKDRLIAVASPDFAKRYRRLVLSSLARMPLIEVRNTRDTEQHWKHWFQNLDYMGDINYAKTVDNYLDAHKIALDGSGVALVWESMARSLIKENKLAQLADFSLEAEDSFYLLEAKPNDMNEAARAFRDWLLAKTKSSGNVQERVA